MQRVLLVGLVTTCMAMGCSGAGDASGEEASTEAESALATSIKPRFGAAFSPHDAARYDAIRTAFGGLGVSRSYDGGKGVAPFAAFQDLDVARHAATAFSFKYMPADVIAGKHDKELHDFFTSIKDWHLTFWTYWHEPDDEIYKSHTFTATQYRQAWRHIRNIANAVKATRPNLRIFATSIIMEYSMRPNIAPSRPLLGPDGMYPGDDVIDVFGVDSYNSGADNGTVRDPATEFGKVIDFAHTHGKPWALGEIGSCPVKGDAGGRARYLTGAIEYWKSRGSVPVYASYFDVDWPTCDYRIENDAAARTVWSKVIVDGVSAF